MKKILLLAAVLGMSMISCKKKYSCTCTTITTYNSQSGSDVNMSSATEYDKKMTKKQAQAACDHEAVSIKSTFDNSFTENGSTSNFANVNTTCVLK